MSPYYYSVEEWMLPLILSQGEEEWRMETRRYVMPADKTIEKPNVATQSLGPAYADYIYEYSHYKQFTDIMYIRDRLSRDISAAIFDDGKPVAWGFTHDDGALGFLHVLPGYRGRGYGRSIVLSRIFQKREYGRPVFCNIVPGNTSAIRLMESLGFEYDRTVYWIKLLAHDA